MRYVVEYRSPDWAEDEWAEDDVFDSAEAAVQYAKAQAEEMCWLTHRVVGYKEVDMVGTFPPQGEPG